eukprot:5062367-Pyramimonas_sp.AAC.1
MALAKNEQTRKRRGLTCSLDHDNASTWASTPRTGGPFLGAARGRASELAAPRRRTRNLLKFRGRPTAA